MEPERILHNRTVKEKMSMLVAVCIKNGCYPVDTLFASRVRDAIVQLFGVKKRVSLVYAAQLISEWRQDRWKRLAQENMFLTSEEQLNWQTKAETFK